MNVETVMTRAPRACRPDDTLAHAAGILWDQDCGAVPVVDGDGQAIGIVTDRDCCMAALTRGRRLEEMSVGSAMAKTLFTIRADARVADALAAMQQHRVRRLPVVDAGGALCGIVSMADLLNAGAAAVTPTALLSAVAAICAPRTARTSTAPPAAAAAPKASAAVLVPKAPAARAAAAPKKPKARARKK
ncbi:MAG: CBS domain-containing protein [Planctomycetota bacterium]